MLLTTVQQLQINQVLIKTMTPPSVASSCQSGIKTQSSSKLVWIFLHIQQ